MSETPITRKIKRCGQFYCELRGSTTDVYFENSLAFHLDAADAQGAQGEMRKLAEALMQMSQQPWEDVVVR